VKVDLKRVHIELTSKCNLKCVHCSLQLDKYDAQRKDLDGKLVLKLLDELSEKYDDLRINLQGIGEASLHADLSKLIQRINTLGFTSETTSNLLAMPKEYYLELFENGLDRLSVSIDTLNKDIIKKTRLGTNLDKFNENLKFISKNNAHKIKIQTVVSDITIDYIDEIYQYLKKLNITNWQIIYLNNFDGTDGISNTNKKLLALKIKNYINMNILTPQGISEEICPQPFDTLHINSLGYVMPCCIYWDNNIMNFGNIKDENIYNIFYSQKFDIFRSSVINKNAKICNNCTLFKSYEYESK